MKKSLTLSAILIFFCFISNISYSQVPDWLWAKTAEESVEAMLNTVAATSVGVDLSGNSYVTGYFKGTISFGSYTLPAKDNVEMFLVKYDAVGNVVWAKSAGGSGDAKAISLAVDHSGNVYLAGEFVGSYFIFGTDTLWGGTGSFVAKYDTGGNVLWARGGLEGWSCCMDMASIAVDSSGNSYLTGGFSSPTLTFGSYILTNAGSSDLFLVKYDADGNVLWAKSVGGSKNEQGSSVMIDNTGAPCVTGYFSSNNLIVGSDTLKIYNSTGANTLLVRYDANGNALWAKTSGTTDRQAGLAVAGDSSGNIYMTGKFGSSSITFGSTILTNTSNLYDIFLVKYDATGAVVWAKSAGGESSDDVASLALDASGNPYITGCYLSSTLIFGTDTLMNLGGNDIFLAKYDVYGDVLWAKSAGGETDDYSNSVAVDRSGNIYTAGMFNSHSLIFGPDTLTRKGAINSYYMTSMFLAKANIITGFPELRNSPGILVFPNPAKDKITIETSAPPVNSQLSIMNLSAQELITQKITECKTVINISHLPTGIYFIRLTRNMSADIGKLIKQ
jgi:hypothetical protein